MQRRQLMMLALAASLLLPAAAQAESPPPPRLMVSGEGEASVAPDLALVSLGVMREARSAREALDANNDAMAAVIAAMKTLGVAERDLQTSSLQINPRYDYIAKPDGTQEAQLAAYQVTNTLSVRIRDIAKVGEVIDRAVSLGVNQGGNVMFGNDDPSKIVTQAREKAVKDAIAKANVLAAAAGVSLGRIIEINDQNIAPPPMPMEAKAFDARSAVPIQAGENAYRIQVSLTFELK